MVKKVGELRSFTYDYEAGPLPLDKLKLQIKKGNCRLAVQDYFFTVHGLYLEPKQILLPGAYRRTGKFIKQFSGKLADFRKKLKKGDVVYAERKRLGKNKEKKGRIRRLHTAVYVDKIDAKTEFMPNGERPVKATYGVWHATRVSGRSCFWPTVKFLRYYQPVAAKRIVTWYLI